MRNTARRQLHRLLWAAGGLTLRYRRWRARLVVRLLCVRDHATVRLELAPDVVIGRGLRIRLRHPHAKGTLSIGAGVRLHEDVEIWVGDGTIRIGDRTEFRSGCRIMADGDLEIGEDSIFSWNCFLLVTERVVIGPRAEFAQNATVVDSRHAWGPGATSYTDVTESAPVSVGAEVFVATNAVILAGATLGRRCLVGASAVVSGEHPPCGLLLGAPARWQPLPARLGGEHAAT